MTDTIPSMTACEIADAVRAGDLKATEVLDAYLERIRSLDGDLNAFVHLDEAGARAQATAIDASVAGGQDPGPLAGLPVGVKDLEDVGGMPTRFGSAAYLDNVPSRDAVHVERLRGAGAVIVGKTATPEFGLGTWTATEAFGVTRNPWARDRTPGGSSGGSAAAVAAGLLPIASGSDGGGSIRIPCSYTGLFGLKPTYGRIPFTGAPDSGQRSVLGSLARTTRDAARWLDVTAGTHERDPYSLPAPPRSYESAAQAGPAPLRAAWSSDLGFGLCAREVEGIARAAADVLAKAASAEWVDERLELIDPWDAWQALGIPSSLQRLNDVGDRAERLGIVTRMLLEQSRLPGAVERMADAGQVRWENNQRLARFFDEADVLVTPTTPTTAFVAEGPMAMEIDETSIAHAPQLSLTFTYPFNLSGHPAVTLPCGLDAAGLPVGLQVVGRRGSEDVLLALAAAFESAAPWPRLAPAYAG